MVVSLPDDLLEGIDREARRRGVSRGDFLRQAAQHELGRPDTEARLPPGQRPAPEQGPAALDIRRSLEVLGRNA